MPKNCWGSGNLNLLGLEQPYLGWIYRLCFDLQTNFVSLEEIPSSLPPAVTNLLQEYADIFPKEVPPGLPPICEIEHQIDLIPEASMPNRAPYRTNPKETKEIQHQVQELLDKGYVRESLSPYK